MSESLEEKQQYLRSEIIEQGYDPDEFSNYMGSLREDNSLDLETWSFADLQTVVNNFRAQMAQRQQQIQNNPQEEQYQEKEQVQGQEQQQEIPQTQEANTNDLPQEGNDIESAVKDSTIPEKLENKIQNPGTTLPKDPFEEFELVKKVGLLKKNDITDQNNLNITISNPVKVKGGIFASSYYQYTVQTNPVGYKAVRKLSDFTFLYETLPIINSAVFNPVLPHFEFGLKDDSPKKMLYIQNYMNSLIENKFFRTLPIVFEFLTLPQEQWNKKRNDYYSKLKPPSLSKMPTLEGEIHIKINKFEDNKGLKIKEEISKKEEAFDNLNNAMDEILVNLEKISLNFKLLAKSYFDLAKCYKDNESLLSFFKRLLALTKTWAKDFIRQRDFLKDEVKYYFKFMNKENVSYLKKYDEFKVSRDEYKSKFEKIKKMPNRTIKDLETLQKLRIDYGCQLLAVNSEYQKLQERQANRCLIKFAKYHENKDILIQNMNNCIKLFNINESESNIVDQHQEQEQEEVENPNPNQEGGTKEDNSQG